MEQEEIHLAETQDTQLIKGILEGCILALIDRRKTYGYEILQELGEAGFSSLQEGTLYPILTRLEKKGFLLCEREKSPLGPVRKYFSITPRGKVELGIFRESFMRITKNAEAVLFNHTMSKEEGKLCKSENILP